MDEQKIIEVTSPTLPPLDEFMVSLKDIWDKRWITNNGYYHQKLEEALCEYLHIPHISLFTNGTIALCAALSTLKIKGEVITTPFSFVATSHVLNYRGIKPVFVDIEEDTYNIDPNRIEKAITSQTSAIMPVHVYGTPCNTKKIQEIANKYHLKVIYDAAHAFNTSINGSSILTEGDISALSFHATKVFNTIEGGAIVCKDLETKKQVDLWKNFGISNETTINSCGINAKMDELRCAYGLINLKYLADAISKRKEVVEFYRLQLSSFPGITILKPLPNVEYNYSYFPILIDRKIYGITRDELYRKLKKSGINARCYFFPLISSLPLYKDLDSAKESNLTIANNISNNILCLPLHPSLTAADLNKIISIIKSKL